MASNGGEVNSFGEPLTSNGGEVNSFGEPLRQPLTRDLLDIQAALCRLNFNDPDWLVQLWLLTPGEVGLLRTSRMPFAIPDNNEGHLPSFREASIKHTYFVGKDFLECTGFPGRVIFRKSAQCIENVQDYAKQLYPQLEDAVNCGVRGCLYLPVFRGQYQYPVGVVELAMLVAKPSFADEWGKIYTTFKAINLDVPVPNLPDNKKKGKWKLDKLIPEVIEPCFYKMKLEDAANMFGVSKSTLRKATRNAGYNEWPLVERLRGSPSTNIQEANPQPEGTVDPTNSARGPVHKVSTFADLFPEQINCFPPTTLSSACPSLGTGSWEAGTCTPMYHGVNQGDRNWDSKVDMVSTEDNTILSFSDYVDESVNEPIEGCQQSEWVSNMSDPVAGSSEVAPCTPEGGSLNGLNFTNMEDGVWNGLNFNCLEAQDEDIYYNTFFWKCDDPFPGL